MFKSFKINTAIFICAAFILKLLFVNVGVISNLNNKNGISAKTQFSAKIKRRRTIEASATSGGTEYTAEICEEDSNEDTQLKSNPFLMQILYSFTGAKLSIELKKILPSGRNIYYTESKRHLALQVFRI